MTPPLVYADFNNADPAGRLRLNLVGTVQDLARLGVVLREGLTLIVHDEELQAVARVHFSEDEHIWVAAVDWDSVSNDVA